MGNQELKFICRVYSNCHHYLLESSKVMFMKCFQKPILLLIPALCFPNLALPTHFQHSHYPASLPYDIIMKLLSHCVMVLINCSFFQMGLLHFYLPFPQHGSELLEIVGPVCLARFCKLVFGLYGLCYM